ncbi:MAG: hypothetical protein QM758_28770 [Armatimonas sp.]
MPAKILVRAPESQGQRQVFQCAGGCTHLTFDSVTLNFPDLAALRTLAEQFRKEAMPGLQNGDCGSMELRYRNITLNLTIEDAKALGQLLEELEFRLLGIPPQPSVEPKEALS